MSAARLAPEDVRSALADALHKIHNAYEDHPEVRLTRREADALYAELERVANYVTLCGEPSTAEWAGVGPFRAAAFARLNAATAARDRVLAAPVLPVAPTPEEED